MKQSEYESNLRSAYAVIALQQQRMEAALVRVRSAGRQLELYLLDGERNRVTVALANLSSIAFSAVPEQDETIPKGVCELGDDECARHGGCT